MNDRLHKVKERTLPGPALNRVVMAPNLCFPSCFVGLNWKKQPKTRYTRQLHSKVLFSVDEPQRHFLATLGRQALQRPLRGYPFPPLGRFVVKRVWGEGEGEGTGHHQQQREQHTHKNTELQTLKISFSGGAGLFLCLHCCLKTQRVNSVC